MVTTKYNGWKKDFKSLKETVEDISQKMNHIVDQTRQIYFALSCLDDLRKYTDSEKESGYHNEYEDSD